MKDRRMEFKDYYNILGVKPDAGSKEIKAAYRKLALKYHPDMNSDARAEAKFKELAEAYKVLKHPKRRAEYDQLRQYRQQSSHGFRPPPGWRSTSYAEEPDSEQFEGDFSEFFNSIFGQHRATFRQRASAAPQRGQDIEIELPLFLEETIQQTHKTIEYQLPVFRNGRLEHVTKQLKIKVPMGSCDGERIRVPGQGHPSSSGGFAGDLYLHVRLVPHPLFDVQGHHLYISLPLSPWEAALGTKVTLPTLEGKISLSIPANTQAGRKLRVKGKGLRSKNVTGDLFAVVSIAIPNKATPQQQALWQALASSSHFNPRAAWRE